MTRTDPDTLFNKAMELMTINDADHINKNYEKIDRLMMELDDHRLNGRNTEVIKVLNEINGLLTDNRDIRNRSYKLIRDILHHE